MSDGGSRPGWAQFFFNAERPVAFICIRKKTFSAFHCAGWRVAAVRERAATGGLKRCEEIMGPFTLFRLTWGGASQTCDGDVTFILPSLSLSHISTPDCSSDSESAESLMTERRREDGSGAEKEKKSSLASDKCELEASEAPRCADSKVSYPTKQQVHSNYSAWPRAAGSLWVFVEKRSSGGFLHKSTKTREERKKRFPSSTLDQLRAKLLSRSFSSRQTCDHITAAYYPLYWFICRSELKTSILHIKSTFSVTFSLKSRCVTLTVNNKKQRWRK